MLVCVIVPAKWLVLCEMSGIEYNGLYSLVGGSAMLSKKTAGRAGVAGSVKMERSYFFL